jgi:hypothetical protein
VVKSVGDFFIFRRYLNDFVACSNTFYCSIFAYAKFQELSAGKLSLYAAIW